MKLDIPDPLGVRLQRYSVVSNLPVPSLIERWADYFEEKANRTTVPAPAAKEVPEGGRTFDPLRPPDLAHTRARGNFDTAPFSKWNDLLRTAHIGAFAKVGSFEELKKITNAQILKGNHSDNGYHFLPEIGISLQGVDSNHAWTYSLRLAQYLKIPIHAMVEWRHNAKARYPGQTGILEWSPE
jgi:hypothetical protein